MQCIPTATEISSGMGMRPRHKKFQEGHDVKTDHEVDTWKTGWRKGAKRERNEELSDIV